MLIATCQGVSSVAHPVLPSPQSQRLQPAGLHQGEAGHLRGRDQAGDQLGDEDSAAEADNAPGDTGGAAIVMMMSIQSVLCFVNIWPRCIK